MPSTLPTLYLIQFTLEIFQRYEKLFQQETPTIHLLYDKQVELFRNTLLQFCKLKEIGKIKDDKELTNFDFNKAKNQLSYNKIIVGMKTKELISKITNQERDVFLCGVKDFYVKLSEHLLKNLSLNNKYLANLRFLNPVSRSVESEKWIVKCAQKLPPGSKITHVQLDTLATEWKMLILDKIPKNWYIDESNNYIPIDKYWSKIIDMKDQNNEPKYPVISKVVKCCFAIFEANASVERLFSQITHIIDKEQNRLSLDSVKGLLHSKDTCTKAKIDNRLMYNAKAAHARYNAKIELKKASTDITLKREL